MTRGIRRYDLLFRAPWDEDSELAGLGTGGLTTQNAQMLISQSWEMNWLRSIDSTAMYLVQLYSV